MSNRASPFCWVRVDDRLIHGQVIVGWKQHLRYDRIWIVDDSVRADPFLCDVLRLSGPDNVPVGVYSMEEAAATLAQPRVGEAGFADRILLLLKNPQVALALVEAGVSLTHLNIGNLSSSPGSKRVFRTISLTRENVAALDALSERGVRITFQLVPDDAQADWQSIRRRHEWIP